MSGGHFEYNQYRLNDIAGEIEEIIKHNNTKDEYGNAYNFSAATLKEFKKAIELLEEARIYAQRVDYLVSGDDGEDSFHEHLKADLDEWKSTKST